MWTDLGRLKAELRDDLRREKNEYARQAWEALEKRRAQIEKRGE